MRKLQLVTLTRSDATLMRVFGLLFSVPVGWVEKAERRIMDLCGLRGQIAWFHGQIMWVSADCVCKSCTLMDLLWMESCST